MATTEAESAAVEAMTGLFDGPNDGGDDDDEQEVDGAEAALVSIAVHTCHVTTYSLPATYSHDILYIDHRTIGLRAS